MKMTSFGRNAIFLGCMGLLSQTHAQTNSWIGSAGGSWEDPTKWSLGVAPTNPQTAYITNEVTKTVTVDGVTSVVHPETMTVSNLILSGSLGAVNTLELVNAGTNTPLRILDTFSIARDGMLQIAGSGMSLRSQTNSITNCFFSIDGEVALESNSVLTADSGIYLGVETNANAVLVLTGGRLVLTNNVVSALGVFGEGFVSVTQGRIQTASGFLIVGSGKASQGSLILEGGDYDSSQYARMAIGMETGAVGVVSVIGGNLIATNSLVTLVGGDGHGQLDLFAGMNTFGPVEIGGNAGAAGTLTAAGATNRFQAGILLGASPGATGALWVTGGQVVQTNAYLILGATNYSATCVGSRGVGTLTVSNGNWYGGAMVVGARSNSLGTVKIEGGTITLLSKLSLGSWTNGNGVVHMNAGSLNVTNAAGSASLIVGGPAHPVLPLTNCNNCLLAGWTGDGTFIQNGGIVTTDKLVMTNGASSVYQFNAGLLRSKATTVSGLQTFIVFTTPSSITSSIVVTNPQTFVVGDGIRSATFHLLGGVHTFVTDLKVRTNAVLTGCGTIAGNVLVEGTVLADCGSNLVFVGTVTNNATLRALNGSTLEFFGPVVNNGLIDVIDGNTNFHAGVVNHGIILDAGGDYDGDGLSNLQESLAGTDPTNNASSFRITSILRQGEDFLVSWTSVTNKTYILQAGDSMTSTFTNIGTVTVPAMPPIAETNYFDFGAATNAGARFYRVRVLTP